MKIQIIIQPKYDRVIFLSKTGINYHQGIDNIDVSFIKPDEELSKIYFKLLGRGFSKKKAIKRTLKIHYLTEIDYPNK